MRKHISIRDTAFLGNPLRQTGVGSPSGLIKDRAGQGYEPCHEERKVP